MSTGAEITVHGMVQGVGYRYFCHSRAARLGITGWVKNNPDRTVALYVEGERTDIESFMEELKEGPSHATVSKVDVRWKPFTGKYHYFEIVR